MQVGAHHAYFIVFFVEVVEKNVAQGNNAFQFTSRADRQVPEPMPLHQGHASLEGIARCDGQRIFGHDLADRSASGVLAADHHTAHQIALGENAGQWAFLKNRYGADVVLHHHASDFEHGLMGLGGYYDLIPEQITDQHLNLPWMLLLWTSPVLLPSFKTNRHRSPGSPLSVFIYGPAAEYMSKIARKEVKNEDWRRVGVPGSTCLREQSTRFGSRP